VKSIAKDAVHYNMLVTPSLVGKFREFLRQTPIVPLEISGDSPDNGMELHFNFTVSKVDKVRVEDWLRANGVEIMGG
jgi:hypothetical protein